MKTSDPRDPLDRKIDALLRELPVPAPADFLDRTLAQTEVTPAPSARADGRSGRIRPLLRFALPLAAAVALAFVLTPLLRKSTTDVASPDVRAAMSLNPFTDQDDYAQLLSLQDGLASLATLEPADDLDSNYLLQTLDTLLYHFES